MPLLPRHQIGVIRKEPLRILTAEFITAKSAKTITIISSILIPIPPGTRNCSEEASSPYGLLRLFQAETGELSAVLPLTLHPFPMHDKRRRFLRTLACSEMTCEGGSLLQGLNFRGLCLPDHSRRLRDSGPRSLYAGMYEISRFAP